MTMLGRPSTHGLKNIRLPIRRGLASSRYLTEKPSQSTSTTPEDLTNEQRRALNSAIRVDQAGELAANAIYQGQLFILGRDAKVGPIIQVSSCLALDG